MAVFLQTCSKPFARESYNRFRRHQPFEVVDALVSFSTAQL